MNVRLALLLASTVILAGCDGGKSACDQATRNALAPGSTYKRLAITEDSGQTPAMTYYVVDYLVTDTRGARRQEQVHCAYMRDTAEATPHLISSRPAALQEQSRTR